MVQTRTSDKQAGVMKEWVPKDLSRTGAAHFSVEVRRYWTIVICDTTLMNGENVAVLPNRSVAVTV